MLESQQVAFCSFCLPPWKNGMSLCMFVDETRGMRNTVYVPVGKGRVMKLHTNQGDVNLILIVYIRHTLHMKTFTVVIISIYQGRLIHLCYNALGVAFIFSQALPFLAIKLTQFQSEATVVSCPIQFLLPYKINYTFVFLLKHCLTILSYKNLQSIARSLLKNT